MFTFDLTCDEGSTAILCTDYLMEEDLERIRIETELGYYMDEYYVSVKTKENKGNETIKDERGDSTSQD